MAAALGSLVVTLGLDAAKFTAGLTKAEFETRRWRAETLKAAKEVGAILGTGAAAAAGGLALMTKSAIDAADSLNKLTQKTGESAEVLSGLQYAFELGDVAGDEFAGSMGKLAKNMAAAASGTGEQADAFKALGVSVKNADGSLRPVAKVLDDVAARFASFADGPEKTAYAMALFGKSGAALIPTLNAGSAGLAKMADEAKALGIIIDGETAKAAEEFNDTLTRLGKGSEALGNRLARELLPALQAGASALLDATTASGPFAGVLDTVAGAARTAAEALLVLGANVAYVAVGVGREIGAIAAQAVALASLDIRGFNAISEAVKEDGKRARAELDAFERRVLGVSNAASYSNEGRNYAPRATAPGAAPRFPGGAAKQGKPAAESEAARYLEALQKQVEGLRTLGAEEKALADIQAKRIGGITPALEKQILAQARLLDQDREAKALRESRAQAEAAAAGLSTKLAEAAALETEEAIKSNQALREELEVLKGGEEARRRLEQQRIADAIATKEQTLAQLQNTGAAQGDISTIEQQITLLRQRAEIMGQIGTEQSAIDAAKAMSKETEKTNQVADELGMTFASAFEEGIVKGNGLRDVLKGLGEDILRLTTRQLVTKPFAEAISGWAANAGIGGSNYAGQASGGGYTGNEFDGAGGGWAGIVSAFAGLFGGGKATGGAVEAGGLYRVNERGGAEMLDVNGQQFLMMGNRRGRVHPNPGAAAGGRGGIHAPVTINMPQGANAQTANQVGALVSRHLLRAAARAS
jgi:hypothetical protein